MDQILSTVGELLLKAVPTAVIVIFLYFFLKSTLFGPLANVLAEREALTEGAREKASASSKSADEKAAELENALRAAKAELYKDQEGLRRQWLDEQAAQLKAARAKADDMVAAAKTDLAAEAEAAKVALAAESDALADTIAKSLLEKKS